MEYSYNDYAKKQELIRKKAAEDMQKWIDANGLDNRQDMINFAKALSDKYGEAAAAYACEMYDAIAMAQGAAVPSAIPAEVATYGEVGKAINGSLNQSELGNLVAHVLERLVKQAAEDTMVQNAARDHAEFAWIPDGGACAFCIMLASRGWQYASKKLQGSHAEHIHANCGCEFAIRFDKNTNVKGYDPEALRKMYDEAAPGKNSEAKLKALRKIQNSTDYENDFNRKIYSIIDKLNAHKSINIKDIPSEHYANFISILSKAPYNIIDFTNNNIDKIEFINLNALGIAKTTKDGIIINLEKQIGDNRGDYTSMFHEIGHVLDIAYGDLSHTNFFRETIKNDFNNMVLSVQEYYQLNQEDAYKEISKYLNSSKMHSVSDICGIITKNECAGKARHSDDYGIKVKDALERETFAHFYEATARNDSEKINNLKDAFPESYKIFEDIIRGLV